MGKVVLAGVQLGCAQEALTVIAMVATDTVCITPRHPTFPFLCLPSSLQACLFMQHSITNLLSTLHGVDKILF